MSAPNHNFTDGHGRAVFGGKPEHIHSETYCQKMLLVRYWLSVDELGKAQTAMASAMFHHGLCKAYNVDPLARRDFVELPRWVPASKTWRAAA